jgi:alpha-tubulin suppressor-like RCC1 family protein
MDRPCANKIAKFHFALFFVMAFALPAKASLTYTFNSSSDVAATSSNYTASGALSLSLGFVPTPGTNLTVVKNTGTAFISGTFGNVPQGGTVSLSYNGITYNYIANYYGGNGRSLVLHWPFEGLCTWGIGSWGHMDSSGNTHSMVPKAVNTSGGMAGKTIVAITASPNGTSPNTSLALTSDGKVFSFGDGDAGNNYSPPPVAMSDSGLLAGKTVVAIASGSSHSLALTSDGQVFAWGNNYCGQLGNNSLTDSSVPVPVNTSGVLAGKTVVAISAGDRFSLALTSDGLVFAWGLQTEGQGGSGVSSTPSIGPHALTTLAAKTVIAISAGERHCLALTSDGKVYAWGWNLSGQLGNNSTTNSGYPVAVVSNGALTGKTVVAIAAGVGHSLALTSDGKVFAWGSNTYGQLGNGNTTNSSVPLWIPVSVTKGGTLKTLSSIAVGDEHSLALSSEGEVFSWGRNYYGQLGNISATDFASYSANPVYVSAMGLLAGTTATVIVASGEQSVVLYGSGVTANPMSATGTPGANATFTATTDNNFAFTVQWQVSSTGSAGAFSDIVDNPTAKTTALTLTNITLAQNGFAYRAVFTNSVGPCTTASAVLTVAALGATFTSSTDIPLETGNYISVAGSLNVNLSFTPVPGTNLTLIKNLGSGLINGTFTNIPQGGIIPLVYNGVTYNYIANYFGENGGSLVLQWPCMSLSSWGANESGQMGTGNATASSLPIEVPLSGVLAGKTIVATAGGISHTLALTSDGKVFAWGSNAYGQLGNGSTVNSSVPVAVSASGLLAGKTVVAIAAGGSHSLALTSDGKVFSWGENNTLPVAMSASGALAGKTVVAIAAGSYQVAYQFNNSHSLALTSDGKVFAWGSNTNGQLGNGSTVNSSVPVAVDTSWALTGKTVVAIAAGDAHSLALTSDGMVFSWGDNTYGQLGNNSTTSCSVPVAVRTSGATGKTVVAIASSSTHSLELMSDGTTFGWGANFYGQLGNGSTTNSLVPIAVSTSGVLSGKSVASIATGSNFSSALTSDGYVTAWGYNYSGQIGNNSTTNSPLPVAVSTSGVLANKTVVGIGTGKSHTIVLFGSGAPSIASNPNNQAVMIAGSNVTFSTTVSDYFPFTVQWQMSATGKSGPFSNIVNNQTAVTGTLTLNNVTLAQNGCAYRAVITNAAGNSTSSSATLTIVDGTFHSATDVPFVTSSDLCISGALNVTLSFPPTPGTNLTLINNLGTNCIIGTFNNVPQGGSVPLTYNGVTYNLVANYYGGNGRSFVLQWPCWDLEAWGGNGVGQLGRGDTTNSSVPVAVTVSGAMNGKTVVATAAGGSHSLTLTTDGMVFSWGSNSDGRLGNNSTTDSAVPVPVSSNDLLNGKTVVAIAGGGSHSLALTSDGKVFAWGLNSFGQLGNNSTTSSSVPVAVNTSGFLAGKTVVSIAAGESHSLALTSDGLVFAWGSYDSKYVYSLVPLNTGGLLAGKTVVDITAAANTDLALTSDGKIFAWGDNAYGQLGNNSTTSTSTPVAVNMNGLLAGKTVTAVSNGSYHSTALTSDGMVFSWGGNYYGQLGNNSTTSSSVPVAVNTSGVLAGKRIVAITAGRFHNLALSSDGKVFAWGENGSGNLGNNSTTNSSVPVAVSTTGSLAGKTVVALAGGGGHSLAVATLGPPSIMVPSNMSSNASSKNGSIVAYTVSATDTVAGTLTPICIPSSGSNFPIGTTRVNCSATNAIGTSTGFFTVTVLRTYASFQDQYGLLNPDVTADPYHTGVCQLLAYAFSVNPSAPDRSQLPLMDVQTGYLQISYPRWKDAADITYVVEVSSDLKNWYSGNTYTQQVGVNPIDSTREQVTVRDLIPTSNVPRRFIRVRIIH